MAAGSTRRAWAVWWATLAFVPLYLLVGRELSATWPDRDPAILGSILGVCAGVGLVAAVLALGLPRWLARIGVAPGPARLASWIAAEAVGIAGLIAWIEGASPAWFAAGIGVEVVLLVLRRPGRSG